MAVGLVPSLSVMGPQMFGPSHDSQLAGQLTMSQRLALSQGKGFTLSIYGSRG